MTRHSYITITMDNENSITLVTDVGVFVISQEMIENGSGSFIDTVTIKSPDDVARQNTDSGIRYIKPTFNNPIDNKSD